MTAPIGSRGLFIAGNWKMNPATTAEAKALAEEVKAGVGTDARVLTAICPPSLFLGQIDAVLTDSVVGLGAQNIHWEASGAYTGEISAGMINQIGCTHVILGHSERRHGLGETDVDVNRKVKAALAAQLIPILCIGETGAERDAGRTQDVVRTQLEGSLADVVLATGNALVLAYEPVWAIGTGLTPTPDEAQAVHAFIRAWLNSRFGNAIGDRILIQYGGSVKPSNAHTMLSQPDIDGSLVGGASLKAADFLAIIHAAQKVIDESRA